MSRTKIDNCYLATSDRYTRPFSPGTGNITLVPGPPPYVDGCRRWSVFFSSICIPSTAFVGARARAGERRPRGCARRRGTLYRGRRNGYWTGISVVVVVRRSLTTVGNRVPAGRWGEGRAAVGLVKATRDDTDRCRTCEVRESASVSVVPGDSESRATVACLHRPGEPQHNAVSARRFSGPVPSGYADRRHFVTRRTPGVNTGPDMKVRNDTIFRACSKRPFFR